MNSVKSELIGSKHKRVPPNLTKEEKDALAELIQLQKDGVIVIQPANKNSGMVIMNRKEYIDEAKRQLEDTLEDENGETQYYYKKSKETEVKKQFKEVEKIIKEGVDKGYITKEQGDKLLPEKPQASKLYLQPKVHKNMIEFLKVVQ